MTRNTFIVHVDINKKKKRKTTKFFDYIFLFSLYPLSINFYFDLLFLFQFSLWQKNSRESNSKHHKKENGKTTTMKLFVISFCCFSFSLLFFSCQIRWKHLRIWNKKKSKTVLKTKMFESWKEKGIYRNCMFCFCTEWYFYKSCDMFIISVANFIKEIYCF